MNYERLRIILDYEETKDKQGWQPIETAPRDKRILVCQQKNKLILTAWGVDEYGNWKTGSGHMDFVVGVTHWMPLPPPPEE